MDNNPRPAGNFEWNRGHPPIIGGRSPFFNTVVSNGVLQALKGTLVGNVISYFTCILASGFASMEKICAYLIVIYRDTRLFVESFQLGLEENAGKVVKRKDIPTKYRTGPSNGQRNFTSAKKKVA